MKRLCAIACALLAILFNAASADVPELLSYQGVLTDGSGVVLPDGPYSILFRLYTVEVGGTPLWQEAHVLTVTKGIFNARLGWTQPLGALDFDLPYYLGISVEGEAELAPRTLLTDAAYAMNARMVKGSAATANRVPATGSVGIGTTSPDHTLTVRGDEQTPLYVNGNDAAWASIYITALQGSARPGYGYVRGSLKAHTYVDPSDRWQLALGGIERLSVTPAGNVGIGVSLPLEKLHVEGGLRIGNSVTNAAGTMRWTGSDFEGYDGSTWKSLTATGGGSLPPGATGQTLWYNGSSWAATSSLYNNNAQIGIGTVDPEARLDIVGADAQGIKVETSSATGKASLALKTTGGDLDYMELTKHAASAGGSTAGVPLANLSRILTGTSAGPLMLQVVSANPMYFVTTNLERMRLDASGNLGINTTSPGAKLHVDGNQWDLTNTEGDFKIGDAMYRLKFGVATGGGGAGTAGIRVMGGAQKLILGGGTAEVLSIDGAGNTSIGGATSNAKLRLYRSGVDSSLVQMSTNTSGGTLALYDNSHNLTLYHRPADLGEGGRLAIGRTGGYAGLLVEGNYGGTAEPRLSVSGSSQGAHFRMDQTGNASVVLPASSIAAAEILDEPGAASYSNGTSVVSLSSSAFTAICSRTITTPASGYVLAIATCQGSAQHTSGSYSTAEFGVSSSSSSFPTNQDVLWDLSTSLPTATYSWPLTLHGLFEIPSGGSYTFYFLGYEYAGVISVYDVQFTLLYVPTAYGTVQPMLAGAPQKDRDAVERGSIDEAFAASERSESEAANAARIERELAAMRAEIDALKGQLNLK